MNPNRPPLLAHLTAWRDSGQLQAIDVALADFLWQQSPGGDPRLYLAAALVSAHLAHGHPCLDLAQLGKTAQRILLRGQETAAPDGSSDPSPPDLLATLNAITLADWRQITADNDLIGSGSGNTPLVRHGDRLYLRRYWHYEREVWRAVQTRINSSDPPPSAATIAPLLKALFPHVIAGGEWQPIACALAARQRFAIITGGPGSGKTTTVVRLLALLQGIALQQRGRPWQIQLAAPTGKAAARLNSAIASAIANLPLTEDHHHGAAIRAAIPHQVTTLHRLLGSRGKGHHFHHHAANPLPLDLLVIDEASMIDIEMMAAVVAALPQQARLILIGDKDQLASVEAGALLGELCQRAERGHYTPAVAAWLREASGYTLPSTLTDTNGTPLDQAIVMLRHSFRFSGDSAIGHLASAINHGHYQRASELCRQPPADLRLITGAGLQPQMRQLILGQLNDTPGYAAYLRQIHHHRPAREAPQAEFDQWAATIFDHHGRFQLLTPLRGNRWGVEAINRLIERWLAEAQLIDPRQTWYSGRPIIITRNNYPLGLMNGDIGILLTLPDDCGNWQQRVAFRDNDTIRWIHPARLQGVETVYALTVHKSQGSEFDHLALILPDTTTPLLNRELLYTAITRARQQITLINAGDETTLSEAIRRRVVRNSGLLSHNWPITE
jgi:exodeoxyribonuclease V alpha subunit